MGVRHHASGTYLPLLPPADRFALWHLQNTRQAYDAIARNSNLSGEYR
jgi:hypothetical protein